VTNSKKNEVLKLRSIDIQVRKFILKDPKSGKEQEVVFIPPKVADRLQEYTRQKCRNTNDRNFAFSNESHIFSLGRPPFGDFIEHRSGLLGAAHLRIEHR